MERYTSGEGLLSSTPHGRKRTRPVVQCRHHLARFTSLRQGFGRQALTALPLKHFFKSQGTVVGFLKVPRNVTVDFIFFAHIN